MNLSQNRRGKAPLEAIPGLGLLLPLKRKGSPGAHQRLHDRVVGRVHVRVEWEGALSVTVVGGVALGCDDPVLR